MENEMIMENVQPETPEVLPVEPAPTAKEKKKLPPQLIGNIIITAALTLGAVIMLFPFLWMILATLKPAEEIYTTFFPNKWTLRSFSEMWTACSRLMKGGIIRGFFNSILTTVPVVLVQIVVSAFAAYAFAKLHFVGKNIIFLVLLSTMMIPFSVIMLPQAWLYGKMGLTATGPLAVIIPKFFGSIGTVFFLRAFFYSIPDSITEAARLDGAGYTRTFVSVLLPLVMPALATQAILSFIGNWNDFLGPLLFINDRNWYTLPLLVNRLNGQGGSYLEVPRVLAASLISLVPIVIVFAVFQKKIIGSIVFSAVKG